MRMKLCTPDPSFFHLFRSSFFRWFSRFKNQLSLLTQLREYGEDRDEETFLNVPKKKKYWHLVLYFFTTQYTCRCLGSIISLQPINLGHSPRHTAVFTNTNCAWDWDVEKSTQFLYVPIKFSLHSQGEKLSLDEKLRPSVDREKRYHENL